MSSVSSYPENLASPSSLPVITDAPECLLSGCNTSLPRCQALLVPTPVRFMQKTHLPRPLRRGLENLTLHLTRQIRINRRHDQLRHFIPERIHGLFQILLTRLNLILTRQEEQDIPFRLGSMDLENGSDGCVNIVGFGLLRVKHVDGESSAGDVEYGGIVNEFGEFLGVQCGG